MRAVTRHFTKTFIAGIVALLPIGGIILGIVFAEDAISESWLAEQPWYFPGLGMLAVLVATYLIGLTITTFIGRVVWKLFDWVLEQLPGLGMLYRTLKQTLGYGEGEGAMFERVVLVPGRDQDAMELGLVTNTLAAEEGRETRLVVFVPAAPTPTSGRVVIIDEACTRPMSMSVHDALKFIVAVGKLDAQDMQAALG